MGRQIVQFKGTFGVGVENDLMIGSDRAQFCDEMFDIGMNAANQTVRQIAHIDADPHISLLLPDDNVAFF
jgi:hypothetical protein